jgi:ABC-2 type transport system permease protein
VRKTWLIAAATYRRRVRAGTFLFLTCGLPVIMIVAGAVPLLRERGSLPAVGYVDETGQLARLSQVTLAEDVLNVTAYADAGEAWAAYQRGEIEGYLLIPSGYIEGEPAVFHGSEQPGGRLHDALEALVRRAMLPDAPDWALARLANPSEMTYVDQARGVEVEPGLGMVLHTALPAILALLFGLAVFTGASQLGSAVVHEKEQRAMEMLVTSLSPRDLVAGKVLGMGLLSLTQLGIWAGGAGIAVALALSGAGEPPTLTLPWEAVVWGLLLGVPGYFLYSVLAAGLGIIAGNRQQAQQLGGLLGFVGLAPFWLIATLLEAPNGPLAVALTLFPLSSPMFGLLRMALADVPRWQLAAGLALIVAGLMAAVWAVARVFRVGMLMYGRRVRPQELLQALREARA